MGPPEIRRSRDRELPGEGGINVGQSEGQLKVLKHGNHLAAGRLQNLVLLVYFFNDFLSNKPLGAPAALGRCLGATDVMVDRLL